jgi:hypothetical protein
MRFVMDYGIPAYGPDASNDSFRLAFTWPEVASTLQDMLKECAVSENDAARSCAESGDYETAWKTREHADEMWNLAASLDNKRQDAPLYADKPELWAATIRSIVFENFPYDVNSTTRIYAWESDSIEQLTSDFHR